MKNNFQRWFSLMWKNNFIQLFFAGLVFMALVIYSKSDFDSAVGFGIMFMIPCLMCQAIGYFGFYKFWQERKNDTDIN